MAAAIDFEEEESAGWPGVETGGFDDAHECVGESVAVDVARVETIDGVGQGPTFVASVVVGHLDVVERVRDGD